MHAEIIAIGTELTTGAKLDTNSQWLSLELSAKGIPVRYHTTIADDMEAIVGELRAAVNRSDLVILTGGLGPTLDDLTRQALAELSQVKLILDEPSLAYIRSLFTRRQREMPESNVIQAMFPAGSEIIANPRGTAPGIWMEVPRKGRKEPCRIAALPGVPSEMKPMFVHAVLPRLPGTGNVIRRARLNCFGVGESDAERILGDVTARGRDPEVGITAHEATITLRIEAHGATADECEAKIAATKQVIRERMGDFVFGEGDEELEDVVIRELKRRGLTVSTAESGTGGLLANRLTSVPGAADAYLGGVVAPTVASKRQLLDTDPRTLETEGPVSQTVTAALARGCRARFGSDFALAVTDIPLEFAADQAPTTYVAIVGPALSEAHPHILVGDPAIARSRAAKAALNLLRLHLLQAK